MIPEYLLELLLELIAEHHEIHCLCHEAAEELRIVHVRHMVMVLR